MRGTPTNFTTLRVSDGTSLFIITSGARRVSFLILLVVGLKKAPAREKGP